MVMMVMMMMMRMMRMMRMTWMWWDMLDITNLTLERGLWNVDLRTNSPFVQCIYLILPPHSGPSLTLSTESCADPKKTFQQTGRWCIMSPAILGIVYPAIPPITNPQRERLEKSISQDQVLIPNLLAVAKVLPLAA